MGVFFTEVEFVEENYLENALLCSVKITVFCAVFKYKVFTSAHEEK